MNFTSIYFSPTGTTKKVIETIKNEIFYDGKAYDMTLPENRNEEMHIDDESILIIGAPVYSGRIPEIFEKLLKKVEVYDQKVIVVAIYGNRAYEDALLEMKDIFEEKNCVVIGAAAFIGEHSCTGKVGQGRPDVNDIEKIKMFAREIQKNFEFEGSVEVKGNRPYRERKPSAPLGPSTNNACTQCGLCSEMCPVGAIDTNDAKKVDETVCIHCFRCVRNCPEDAKFFDERFNGIINMLEAKCSVERLEPEIFIK
ncbi:MAG: EFR1 family ferrodoxin [Clostridiales bacterium]|nr:EFR1 family ferrodoxin [Clostridiales bacterium]